MLLLLKRHLNYNCVVHLKKACKYLQAFFMIYYYTNNILTQIKFQHIAASRFP